MKNIQIVNAMVALIVASVGIKMTLFDMAWGVVKGLEPVEERTENKLDQVLEEVRNRPPKEGIELPGMVRTGSDTGKCICGETWFNGDCKSDHCLWEAEE